VAGESISATCSVLSGFGWCIGSAVGRFSRRVGFWGKGYAEGWGRWTVAAMLISSGG